ncbi:CBS domain-containing protein [Pseudomonas sp.]|jgi:CBS domain-containing protein|uniref:CBS domain-containing protein n=1 Tax=Pseudomonas sp. TaxID=306 RepID=UPI0028A63E73|nr:CBS domain-containing protein [Pseudomonas sp.]
MKSVAQILKGKQIQSIHTIAPEDTVLDALRQMAEKNVGALPVTNADGQLVGIVSERDYARKVVLLGRSSIGTPVSAIMTAAVITVDPRQDIKDCMQLMTERHLRHLPVLDEGRLIGLLSIGDLVKEITAEQESLIQQLEGYIRGE